GPERVVYFVVQPTLRRGKHGGGRNAIANRSPARQTSAAFLWLERTGRELWLLSKICRGGGYDRAAPAGAPPHRRRPGAARRRLDLQCGFPAYGCLVSAQGNRQLQAAAPMDSSRLPEDWCSYRAFEWLGERLARMLLHRL